MKFILAVLCLGAVILTVNAGQQKVTVKGKLMCGNKPYAGAVVKLVDEDTGPDPDDTMARVKTGSDGRYTISGQAFEIGSIEPILKIYHDCNDKWKPCQRKWKFEIPDKYINGKTMDMGLQQLEVKMSGEGRDCFH